jgi:hypothetical protein
MASSSRKPASQSALSTGSTPTPIFNPRSFDHGYQQEYTHSFSAPDQFAHESAGRTLVPAQFNDLDSYSTFFPFPGRDPSMDGSHGPYPLTPYAMDKFPSMGAPEFSLNYGTGPMAPLSVSPPSSTISRRSSARSTLSSVHTDIPSQQSECLQGCSSWSRGPSPLRNIIQSLPSPSEASTTTARDSEGRYDCLATRCGANFPQERDLQSHVQFAHSHVCLWGDDGPCESGGFATREELNWHVKSEHLLVCPVLGCTESSFPNKDLVDCHLRWQHKGVVPERKGEICQSSNLLKDLVQDAPAVELPEKAKAPIAKVDSAEDRRLKMEMSIGISKKRCRDQLKNVIDKKYSKTTGKSSDCFNPGGTLGTDYSTVCTPRSVASPGLMRSRTPRLIESVSFPIIWEHGVLPFLVEFIPKWCGPGHVISVTRGKKRDSRRICFMTGKPISKARKILIAGHVRDLLPECHRSMTTFVFSVGEVDRLTWARGLSKKMPDEVCAPRNPFCYISPCMGDSIGTVLPNGDDTTATLGPCVMIGGGSYWLSNFHPFVEANQAGAVATVEHPSPADRDLCLQEKHDALDGEDMRFRLGNLTATSGYDLKTTRITHDPYWEDCDKEPPLIVTDWTLISSKSRQANILRKFPNAATPNPRQEVPVTRISSIVPGIDVCSTGRTSGYQRGQVCEIPAYVDGNKAGNGTGKATREWFIEEPYPYDEEAWIRGGMGVQGDSGAAVIDCETNALIGQLWGRNKYFGPGPRQTFFTPIFDIFDDIQERCGEQTRPHLPQYRDEADRWPVYPVCKTCFELREYLDSRRSSRESIMSMIPGAGALGEKEHDLTSVSEMATPKAVGDQAYWVRHTGVEDVGLSFNSVVSPAPMSTFFYNQQIASPGPSILELRSPYALTLNDDDLYETRCPSGGVDGPLGKRTAGSPVMMRSGSQQSTTKKRRIM